MNVKQLRNLLLDYPDDLEILIASDEEGNDLNPLIEMSIFYRDEADDDDFEPEDDGDPEFIPTHLVLWP